MNVPMPHPAMNLETRETPANAPTPNTWNSRPWITRAVMVLLCLGMYLGWSGIERSLLHPTDIRLIIDAQISSGRQVEAFFNGSVTPVSVKRASNERELYVLKGVPSSVRELRLDLTDVPNGEVVLYGIRFERDGEVIASYSADQLRQKLSFYNMSVDAASRPGLTMRAANNDPIVLFSPKVFLGRSSEIPRALEYIEEHLTTALLFVGLLGLIVAGGTRQILCATALSAALGLGWWGLTILATIERQPRFLPVSLSVGNASYTGYAKGSEFSMYWSFVAFALCLAALGALGRALFRKLKHPEMSWHQWLTNLLPSSDSRHALAQRHGVRRWLIVAGDIAFLGAIALHYFLIMFPRLAMKDAALGEPADPGDYDGVNFFSWSAFRIFGLLPHRDYWFPYAGFYDALYDTPFDLFNRHLYSTIVWSFVSLGIYLITNRSKCATLLVTVVLYLFVFNNLLVGYHRYLIGIGIIVLAAVAFTRRPHGALLALLGAYAGYISGKEPNQIIYASVALVMILGLTYNYWKEHPLKVALYTTIGGILGSASWLIPLTKGQEVEAFVAFYVRMGGLLNAVAIPSGLTNWIVAPSGLDALVILLGLALVFVAGYLTLSHRPHSLRTPLYVAAFGAGLLFCLTFTKQLARPHMANQLVGIALIGVTLVFIAWTSAWNRTQRVWFAVWLAVFAAHIDSFWAGPYTLLSNTDRLLTLKPDLALAFSPKLADREEEQRLYERTRFTAGFPFLAQLTEIVDQDTKATGQRPMVYVLGDDSFVYPVLRQIPPRFISFYNMSDIREQREVVAWLGTHEPKYILWNPSFKVFDGVPQVVRVPEVFSYVIARYQLYKSLDGFDLLVRKTSDSSVPLVVQNSEYWRATLGQELALGALPALSSIRDNALCEPGSVAFCEPVIRIRLKRPPQQSTATSIDMELGGRQYRVSFSTLPNQRNYFIKWSSLWFVTNTPISSWKATCSAGGSACENVAIEYRRFLTPHLY